MRVLIHLTFLFIFLNFSALAYEIKVFEFNQEELNSLEVRKVRGADAKTKYSIGKNDKGNFLKAVANNAASGLGKQIKINLNNTPILNITWKVEKDLSGINERSKKGAQHLYQIEQ